MDASHSLPKRLKINDGGSDITLEPSDSKHIKVEPSDSEAACSVKFKRIEQVTDEYLKAANESKGFDFSRLIPGGISPLIIRPRNQEFLTMMSRQALDEYNRKENATFQFVKLVKAEHQANTGRMYYITFKAKADEDKCQNFHAIVWKKVNDKGTEVTSIEKI